MTIDIDMWPTAQVDSNRFLFINCAKYKNKKHFDFIVYLVFVFTDIKKYFKVEHIFT